MVMKIGEYQGKPVLYLKSDSNKSMLWLSFGPRKAKLVLEHIEDIKKFYEDNKHLIDQKK